MSRQHNWLAVAAWAGSWVLALAGGTWFAHAEHLSEGLGVYWAITTVETVGYGDVTPHTVAGHWIAAGTMLLAIPVWSLSFAFATSWLMSLHLGDAEARIKGHVDRHHGGQPRA